VLQKGCIFLKNHSKSILIFINLLNKFTLSLCYLLKKPTTPVKESIFMDDNMETSRGRVTHLLPSLSVYVDLHQFTQQIRTLTEVIMATQEQLRSIPLHTTPSVVRPVPLVQPVHKQLHFLKRTGQNDV